MFDSYTIPFEIEQEGLRVSIQKDRGTLNYCRDCLGETENKVLLTKANKVQIHPVEPLNMPKQITSYFLVNFDRELVIEPKAEKKVFITFPIEMGVFVPGGKHEIAVLDVFTLVRQKYTLYGSPRGGHVCRWWESGVFSEVPEVENLLEGVIALKIQNETARWIKLNKVVFNALGMKIYYNNKMAAMKAVVNITSKGGAETEFKDEALEKGMKKALEIFTVHKLAITSTKFLMEEGI